MIRLKKKNDVNIQKKKTLEIKKNFFFEILVIVTIQNIFPKTRIYYRLRKEKYLIILQTAINACTSRLSNCRLSI